MKARRMRRKPEVRVRVIRAVGPLGLRHVGDILTPTGGVRDIWLRKGWVEIVKDNAVEAAVVAPERNAAIRTDPPKRRRGRPPGSKNKAKATV